MTFLEHDVAGNLRKVFSNGRSNDHGDTHRIITHYRTRQYLAENTVAVAPYSGEASADNKNHVDLNAMHSLMGSVAATRWVNVVQ